MKEIDVYVCPECGTEPRKQDGDCDCGERLVIETIVLPLRRNFYIA